MWWVRTKRTSLQGENLVPGKKNSCQNWLNRPLGMISSHSLLSYMKMGVGGVFLDWHLGISALAEMIHQAKVPEMNDLHVDCTQWAGPTVDCARKNLIHTWTSYLPFKKCIIEFHILKCYFPQSKTFYKFPLRKKKQTTTRVQQECFLLRVETVFLFWIRWYSPLFYLNQDESQLLTYVCITP